MHDLHFTGRLENTLTDDAADTDNAVQRDDERLVPVVVERCSVVEEEQVCAIHFHGCWHDIREDDDNDDDVMELPMNAQWYAAELWVCRWKRLSLSL